jgi:hypothetical protein
MPKSAYRTDPLAQVRGRGRFHEYGELQWTFPAASFVFAYDSIALTTLAERMYGLAAYHSGIHNDGPQHFIDAVFVLKRGFIHWGKEVDQTLLRRPERDALPCVVESSEPGQVLVAMTSWLNGILGTAWMPRFNMDTYFGSASVGDELKWYRPGGPTTIVTSPSPEPDVPADPAAGTAD